MNYGKPTIHLKISRLLWVCFLLIISSNFAFSQDFKFKYGRKQQTIPFSLIKNLIIVPIYINDKGPFDFILDTGVNPMIITDPDLKESLRVPFPRPIKISGYGNFEEIDAFLGATSVKIGDAEAESISTVFLKDDVLPISGFVGKKIYGLIGYSLFNSFVVKVSYTNKSLKLISHEKKIKLKGEKIPFELIENKPYISLKIKQDGLGEKTIKTLVDCGANHTISLEAWEGKSFPKPEFTINANLGNGLISKINGRMGRIASLNIGSFSFNEVLSSYPEYNIDSLKNKGRNGNLGAEILSRFNTIYDYKNGCMYVKKNERFNRPFEHDMAGIELYTENGPPSRTKISKVEPDSPAELAGLKEDDEIIAINFKKIDDYSLDDVGNTFRAKSGYSVIIEIWREKALLIKLLKLKKRI